MDAIPLRNLALRFKDAAITSLPGLLAAAPVVALCIALLLYAPRSASLAGRYVGLSLDLKPILTADLDARAPDACIDPVEPVRDGPGQAL